MVHSTGNLSSNNNNNNNNEFVSDKSFICIHEIQWVQYIVINTNIFFGGVI